MRRLTRRFATAHSASPLAVNSALNVFDGRAKRLQRDRAASNMEFSRLTDYVRDEVAGIMVDRLLVRLSFR
jgi:NADH dehydrogenase [ubiquinone] 1 alpha subcomplex assembly factor 5